jgi:DNA-binding response OmpR family regulator
MDEFIKKPFDVDHLIARIATLIGPQRPPRRAG